MDKMKPHETLLSEIVPKLMQNYPEYHYLLIPRNQPQYNSLSKQFEKEISTGQIILRKGVANLAHIMYYAKIVLTGCGTMVRESALLGVPSIEFFPLDTYPQEQFLIENGFPLKHVRKPDEVLNAIQSYLEKDHRINTTDKVNGLENPLTIGLSLFHQFQKFQQKK
jgi:predicted glycosyltransferase